MHPTSYYSRLESISTIVVATLLILVSICKRMHFSFLFSSLNLSLRSLSSFGASIPHFIPSYPLTTTAAPAFMYFDQPPSFHLTSEESKRN